MSRSGYIVDVYHININIGDCTLIVLSKEQSGKRPLVQKVIIVDGGRGNAWQHRILLVMNHIKTAEYDNSSTMQFDAVILTHNDFDHYDGLEYMLLDQYIKVKKGKAADANFLNRSGSQPTRLYNCRRAADAKTLGPTTARGYVVVDYLKEKSLISYVDTKTLLLGREFFWDQQPAAPVNYKTTAVMGIDDLRTKIGMTDATRPSLFCVGHNGYALSLTDKSIRIVGKGTGVSNESSAVLMLNSPPRVNSTNASKIVHYLSGDIGDYKESLIVAWKNGSNNKDDELCAFKYAHHGAHTSTPPVLFNGFKPRYGIFSNAAVFLHPTWEAICYSEWWAQTQSRDFGVFSTNYPQYLAHPDDPQWVKPMTNRETNFLSVIPSTDTIVGQYIAKYSNPISIDTNNKDLNDLVKGFWNKRAFPNETKYQTTQLENLAAATDDVIHYIKFTYNDNNGWFCNAPIVGYTDRGDVNVKTTIKNQLGVLISTSGLRRSARLKRVAGVTVPNPFVKKPKPPASSDAPQITWNIYSSIASQTSQPGISLVPQCMLDVFVQSLDQGTLVMQVSSLPEVTSNSPLSVNGSIESIPPNLMFYGIIDVNITINGNVDSKGRWDVSLESNTVQGTASLSIYNPATTVTMDCEMVVVDADMIIGHPDLLQGDPVLVCALQGDGGAIDIIQCLVDANFLSSTATSFLGLSSFPDAVISKATEIVYIPTRSQEVQRRVIAKMGNLSTPIGKINFGQSYLIVDSDGKTLNKGGDTVDIMSSVSIVNTSTINAIDPSITIDADVNFYDENSALFSICVDADSVSKVCTALIGNYDSNPFGSLGLTAPTSLTGEIDINLNLQDGSVNSISLSGSADLEIFGMQLDLQTAVSFPGPLIQASGSLTNSVNFGTMTMGVPVPSCLSSQSLIDIVFDADITNHQYTIQTSLLSGSNSISVLSNSELQISMANIFLSLSTTMGSLNIIISGDIQLEDDDDQLTVIGLTGGYDGSSWIVTGSVSDIDIKTLSLIFSSPTLRNSLLADLPQIQLDDTSFTFNITNGDFYATSTLVLGSADFLFQYTYEHSAENKIIHTIQMQLSTESTVSLKDIFDDLGTSLNSELISNINLPFTQLNINYDISSSILTLSTQNQGGSFVIVINRYYDINDAPQYMTRIAMTNISGFPIVGNGPFPLNGLYLLDVPNGIKQSDYQALFNTDDPNPESYEFIKKKMGTSDLSPGFYAYLDAGDVDIPSIQSPNPIPPGTATPPNPGSPANPSSPPSNSIASWVTVQKNVGPVYIKRLGYDITNGVFWLLLDSSISVGPFTVTLNGFGVGISISPLSFDLHFQLDGLGIDYSTGELSVDGTFYKNPSPAPLQSGLGFPTGSIILEEYSGGLTITCDPYTVTAAGSYCRIQIGDSATNTMTSFFIFGRLNAPLGGPPFAYLTGISAGFGYNQTLAVPTIDNVCNFPLVEGAISSPNSPNPVPAGSNPLEILASLMDPSNGPNPGVAWITPNFNGEKWIAAGVDVISFELLQTRALLIIEFGDDFIINVSARSVFNLPQDTSLPQFVNVELGLTATIHPSAGYMEFRASLTPASFVLDPNCHLTGDFAMIKWYGPNPHAGDFLISLGGYHPAFKAPSYYPALNRLGFNWQYSDNITIEGDAYFALTPIAAMAGGGLNLSFQSGDLKAWFIADTNIIVYWHPFHFDAEVDISVGVSYKLNLGFCSKEITDELSASVEVWGPPVGGRAHVSWWAIGFTVDFGPSNTSSTYLDWPTFKKTLPQDPNTSDVQFVKFSVQNGLLPAPAQGYLQPSDPNEYWVVRGGPFQFKMEFAVPIVHLTYTSSSGNQTLTQENLSVRVMNLSQALQSNYTVRLYAQNISQGKPLQVTLVSQPLPAAIWGEPLGSDSDQGLSNQTPTIMADTTAICSIDPAYVITPGWDNSPLMSLSDVGVEVNDPVVVPAADNQAWKFYPGSSYGVIQQMINAWGDSGVDSQRAELMADLESDNWGPFVTSAPTVLRGQISTFYSEIPWLIGEDLAMKPKETLKIVRCEIGVGATAMHTKCQFQLSSGSSGLRYELYLNKTRVMDPTPIGDLCQSVKMNRILSCVYNPWGEYEVIVSQADGKLVDSQIYRTQT